MENIHAIVLAAGKGTRMMSPLPKCAIPFLGKPMVKHITDDIERVGIRDIYIVVGYKKEDIFSIYANNTNSKISFAIQDEQKGTGHACKCTRNCFRKLDGITLIFPGDMPLVGEEIINDLLRVHKSNHNDLTVVTTIYNDPKCYGRIYRENGNIKKIIEFKDCNEEQKGIKEVNSGLFCVDTKLLFDALDQLKNNNNQGEYYLTDVVEIIGKEYKVDSFIVNDKIRLIGFNTMDELKQTEQMIIDKKLVEKYIK